MLATYKTRVRTVEAVQYDGTNLEEVQAAVEKALGEGCPTLGNFLALGAWIVVENARWRVMPDPAFRREYDGSGGTEKTCFGCVFLTLLHDSSSYCQVFNEGIDSEIAAARDCEAFTTQEEADLW